MSDNPALKPVGPIRSLAYFGIPAVVFAASILGGLPWMIRRGYSPLPTFVATFGGPLALMLAAALLAYRLEGRVWTWPAFRDRMRLGPMSRNLWLWTVALVLGSLVLDRAIAPVAAVFKGVTLYQPPAEFADFMRAMRQGDFGIDLTGRWDVWLLMTVTMLLFNVGGEELWWRGIILPRQELVLGRWAWLVNGVLWDLFHFFYHSNLGSVIVYLPTALTLAYVAQRTRSTWPGIISHFITNLGFPVALFFRALGLPIPG